MFKTSVLFEETYNCKEPIIIHQGGSSSGKTYSILQVLFAKAVQSPLVITVVGQSIPNLKSGALRDALDIYSGSEPLRNMVSDYNKSERIFLLKNGSVIEFKSYLSPQDAKSGKRDYLFINEAQGISREIYNELWMRTRIQTFIDYNPNEEFWVHEFLIGKPKVKLFISDHRHNPFCPVSISEKLEGLKDIDKELFKVYARGLTGKIEGLIFRNYQFVNEIPAEAKFIAHGLDWGFTNDPTALVSVYRLDQELFIQERIYQTHLTNSDIIQKLKSLGITSSQEIICDSSEPKSIEDLRRAGFYANGAKKKQGSVNYSIDLLKSFKLNITKDSFGLTKEIKGYKWRVDNSGKTINEPVDFLNHAIDATLYVGLNKLSQKTSFFNTWI